MARDSSFNSLSKNYFLYALSQKISYAQLPPSNKCVYNMTMATGPAPALTFAPPALTLPLLLPLP